MGGEVRGEGRGGKGRGGPCVRACRLLINHRVSIFLLQYNIQWNMCSIVLYISSVMYSVMWYICYGSVLLYK